MRWPWQRRRTAAGSVGRHALPRQAGSWAQPAFPPGVAAAAAVAEAAVEPGAQPALPVAVPVQASAVLLGFADGTHVALDERDPSALALRAVAEALVEEPRRR